MKMPDSRFKDSRATLDGTPYHFYDGLWSDPTLYFFLLFLAARSILLESL